MHASDIMTRDVVTVGPETTVGVAAALMVEHRISGLPVIDAAGQMVGMFTEGDLLHRSETGTSDKHRSVFMNFLLGYGRSAAEYIEAHSRRVGDLMTERVASVAEDASLQEVVDLMQRRKIRRVAVLRDGKLAGLVSRLDLVRALAEQLKPAEKIETDAEIQQCLETELNGQPWLNASSIRIAVKDHTVTLDGVIFDERIRRALTVAAANVAQGTRIDDRLVWADPSSGMVVGA